MIVIESSCPAYSKLNNSSDFYIIIPFDEVCLNVLIYIGSY